MLAVFAKRGRNRGKFGRGSKRGEREEGLEGISGSVCVFDVAGSRIMA